jgi:hypothetical protein
MGMSDNNRQGTQAMKITSGTRKAVVACLGSCTTAAKGSFNWIGELEKRPQNRWFCFVNLGVGGDLAYSALQRLPGVVACHPDTVIVIVGANDILSHVFENVRRFFSRWKHLPNDPSPAWYRENLRAIARWLNDLDPIERSAQTEILDIREM